MELVEKILAQAVGLTFTERETLEAYGAGSVVYWSERVGVERYAHGSDEVDPEADGFGDEHPFEAFVRRVNGVVQNHIGGVL
jgi:hypothetical protein